MMWIRFVASYLSFVQNYALWMRHYALELVYVKNEKPDVMEALLKEALSRNRSGNAFAGVPVDMDLERSINAHAKISLQEIMAYAHFNSVVNRWHVTSIMRSEIANALLEYPDIKSNKTDNKEVKEQEQKRQKRFGETNPKCQEDTNRFEKFILKVQVKTSQQLTLLRGISRSKPKS